MDRPIDQLQTVHGMAYWHDREQAEFDVMRNFG